MSLLSTLFGNYSQKEIKRILPLQKRVLELEEEYRALSNEELRAKTDEFKNRLSTGETLDDAIYNRVTVVVEERLALAVRYPKAFVKITEAAS